MPPSSDIVVPVGAEHNTLYVAIEISRKSWVIGIKSPASERIGLHSLGAADVVGLKDLIEHQQTKAERALGREVRVLCCYEAGYEGFWLARWLDRTMSVETVVLDPASLLVNRKAKQRKTDRIDARKMVRAGLAHPGDPVADRSARYAELLPDHVIGGAPVVLKQADDLLVEIVVGRRQSRDIAVGGRCLRCDQRRSGHVLSSWLRWTRGAVAVAK